jgi:hypothetical protein
MADHAIQFAFGHAAQNKSLSRASKWQTTPFNLHSVMLLKIKACHVLQNGTLAIQPSAQAE